MNLHRPATRRVAEPSRAHSRSRQMSALPLTHTGPTHVCSHIQRNHHCRDCLCNVGNLVPCDPLHPCKVLTTTKTYDTEHKYINLGCLKTRHTVKHNSNSMGRGAFSSHPRYHPPKKRATVSYHNPTPKAPQNRRGRRPSSSDDARNFG